MRISPLDLDIYDDNDSFDNTSDLWWPDIAHEQDVTVTSTIELLVRRRVICIEDGE